MISINAEQLYSNFVGKRIEELRKEQNISLYRFWSETGIDNRQMHRIIEGRSDRYSIKTVALIADTLSVTLDEFFNYQDPVTQEIVERFGDLTDEQKETLLTFVKSLHC